MSSFQCCSNVYVTSLACLLACLKGNQGELLNKYFCPVQVPKTLDPHIKSRDRTTDNNKYDNVALINTVYI